MNSSIFTRKGNSYIYSDFLQHFMYVPPKFQEVLLNQAPQEKMDEYYIRKYSFLKGHNFFENQVFKLQALYSEELIKRNMACLRQLLIEVTDSCNLKCKYCGYGEFYSNYDERETRNQTFSNVKVLIDYLKDLWTSDYNISHKNTVVIGFYGGEPLLNMGLIKEVISYVENLQLKNISFRYNITTNGMLLHRYMDFLVEKDFSVLISLDGNEYHNSYRVDKGGKPTYRRLKQNLDKLIDTYPSFYNTNVNFNAVLHDRNSVEGCLEFFSENFNKVPRISELNTNGIIKERIEEFDKMFKYKIDSIKEADNSKEFIRTEKKDMISKEYHFVLMKYIGNRFNDYTDLFDTENGNVYVPTGTCKPFENKLFLTVNGKILSCERIGHEHVLGRLKNGSLELDAKTVAAYYSSLYEKIVKYCSHCQLKRACGQCLFFLKEKNGKLTCPNIQNESNLKQRFSSFLSYAEENPSEYENVLSTIIIM